MEALDRSLDRSIDVSNAVPKFSSGSNHATNRLVMFFKNNTHIIETESNFIEWRSLQTYIHETTSPAVKFTSIFGDTCIKVDYKPIPRVLPPSICSHWGQFKLLVCEAEFLALCLRVFSKETISESRVVYAGAAGGRHIIHLARLFPMMKFDLWDPSRFDIDLINYAKDYPNRITIYNQIYTKYDAQRYVTIPNFFLSDVRRTPTTKNNNSEIERLKIEDHELQTEWVNAMRPLATMLKFSPPYATDKHKTFTYFDGINTTQCFGPDTSNESRIIFFDRKLREYDCYDYEKDAMYLNTRMRNIILPLEEFCILRWINNGQHHAQYLPMLRLTRYGDLTYDAWRMMQTYFQVYLSKIAYNVGNTLITVDKGNPDPAILITHNKTTDHDDVIKFSNWFNRQLIDVEIILRFKFHDAFMSRRHISISRAEAEMI